VRWYRMAAERGNAGAQLNLGIMYATGQGVLEDSVEAVKWYRRAASQGDAAAQELLGGLYAIGAGVPKDYVESYFWFNIAAAQGSGSAKEGRRRLENNMTREQIAEAQKRSSAWQPKIE